LDRISVALNRTGSRKAACFSVVRQRNGLTRRREDEEDGRGGEIKTALLLQSGPFLVCPSMVKSSRPLLDNSEREINLPGDAVTADFCK
jgi:hypothetical protein